MDDVDLLIQYITLEDSKDSHTNVENDQSKLETSLAKFKAAKEA